MEFSEVIEVLDRGSSIDVHSNCTFDSLMIGKKTLERLKAHAFNKPSPVQAKAIPVGLLGRDMLVQAKSGTGKTLVFTVLAVENLDSRVSYIQKLIVTPTREIAMQIQETVKKIAPHGSRISVFVGGIPIKLNVLDLSSSHPQIVIGTPGRICQLMKQKAMDISRVDFFALDEADKLMEAVFLDDINYLVNSLPPVRQVAVFSATYPRNMDSLLSTFLRDAALVRFNADDVQLVGIKQYVITKCSPMFDSLTKVLKSVRYVQALVFCDQIAKVEPVASHLKSEGLDVTFVSSAMSQKERQQAVDQLRLKRVKILVSSDLTARGIDADNVNLVVNIDAAANEETYFHRIGRAARFGAHGAAVTLLEDEQAMRCFTALAHRGKVTVKRAQIDDLPEDLTKNVDLWASLPFFIDFDKMKKTKGVNSDLEAVPDRKVAIERLKTEREAAGIADLTYKYDRNGMMALRGEERPQGSPESPSTSDKENQSQKEQQKPDLDEEDRKKKEEPVEVVKKSFKERLAELKEAKKQAPAPPKLEEKAKATKFKFVPTREKAKKKYYMRGELQHIRDAFTAEQWRAYAESKFDLSQEPFLDAFPKSKKVSASSEDTAQSKSSKNTEKPPKKAKNSSKTIKYSRFQMIGIQNAIPKPLWLPYVTSKWDTSDEPWVLDPNMRCSFEERLRRQRKKEKDERRKVMEERKKKREEEQTELVASGRTTADIRINGDSWKEYGERLKREFEEKIRKRDERIELEKKDGVRAETKRIGPVVPQRDPPLIYKYRVDMYKRRLDEQDAYVRHLAKLESLKLAEIETQTEEEEKKVIEVKDGECQTEKEEIPDEEEEYWDEEEEEYGDEEYWDEEQPEEPDLPNRRAIEQLREQQMAHLGAGFIGNINFQAAAQSYMDMMNAAFLRRENQ